MQCIFLLLISVTKLLCLIKRCGIIYLPLYVPLSINLIVYSLWHNVFARAKLQCMPIIECISSCLINFPWLALGNVKHEQKNRMTQF